MALLWVGPIAFGLHLCLDVAVDDLLRGTTDIYGDFSACRWAPDWGQAIARGWVVVLVVVGVGMAWTWLLWNAILGRELRRLATALIYGAGVVGVGVVTALVFPDFWVATLPTGLDCSYLRGGFVVQ